MSFDNLIGNDENKKILNDTIKNEKILHSYLFYGIEGIGKKEFAKELAEMILCNNDVAKPCKKCKSCIEFETNNNPDFILIEPAGNSIKIDQIRQMQKKILEKPIISNKKVYIIDEADKMTKEAQNCLLKTLEEPQEFIVIILITSNENNIIPTVKSRCTKIHFSKIENEKILKYLNEKFGDVHLDESMLKLCDGSISKSIEIIQKQEILNNICIFINEIEKIDELEMINYNSLFYENKADINLLLDYMYILLFYKMKNSQKAGYIKSMEIVQKTKNKILNSNNYDMSIDNMLIKIWREINEKDNRCQI